MTFTPGIPFDGQSLLNAKPLVRGNFTSLYDTIDENHYPPGSATGQGKHKKSLYVEQATPVPDYPSTAVNECVAFARDFNGATELMYRPENTASSGDAWALSGLKVRASGCFDSAGATIGSLFNCTITKTDSTHYLVTFLTEFPIGASTADYGVIIFSQKSNSFVETVVDTPIEASFTIRIPAAGNANPTRTSFIVFGG